MPTNQDDSSYKSKSFQINLPSINLNWKSITIIIAILIGGGSGYTGFLLNPGDNVRNMITASAQEIKIFENKRHEKLDEKFIEYSENLDTLTKAVTELKTMQQIRWAREEARRLTASLINRRIRESAYDRLVDLNLRNIQSNKMPCSNLACE